MPPVHFALVTLEMVVSQTLCLDWPQTAILPISTSQVARITGMIHQHPATLYFLSLILYYTPTYKKSSLQNSMPCYAGSSLTQLVFTVSPECFTFSCAGSDTFLEESIYHKT
jgi:hypothetical protein